MPDQTTHTTKDTQHTQQQVSIMKFDGFVIFHFYHTLPPTRLFSSHQEIKPSCFYTQVYCVLATIKEMAQKCVHKKIKITTSNSNLILMLEAPMDNHLI